MFYVSLRVVMFVSFMFLYVFFLDCKCKSLKRLGENNKQHKETNKQNIKNSKNNIKTKTTEIQDFQLTNLREKHISLRVWLGDVCFSCFVLSVPSSFYVVILCCYMCVFDCKCKSLTTTRRKHNNKT